MRPSTRREFIAGPAGRIECAVDSPEGAARGVALIAHPHPLFGGTLDNKVVQTLARAFVDLGYEVTTACDGAEDCDGGPCCWTFPIAAGDPVRSSCVDACPFSCGTSMLRCHADADCPKEQSLCCFAPFPPVGATGLCVDAACQASIEEFLGAPLQCND